MRGSYRRAGALGKQDGCLARASRATRRSVKTALTLMIALALPVVAADEPPFAKVMADADQVASHGEGMRYANHTKHFLLARHEATAKECAASGAAKFDMLAWVTKDGTVDKVRVEPESPASLCVAKAVTGTRVRHPDNAPWVVHVEWEVAQ